MGEEYFPSGRRAKTKARCIVIESWKKSKLEMDKSGQFTGVPVCTQMGASVLWVARWPGDASGGRRLGSAASRPPLPPVQARVHLREQRRHPTRIRCRRWTRSGPVQLHSPPRLMGPWQFEGLTTTAIAAHFKCGSIAVTKNLRAYGIPVRPQGSLGRRHVPEEVLASWTPDLAYVVGLITSDGALVKNSQNVSLISTDLELLDLYCGCLRLDSAIEPRLHPKQSENCKQAYTVKFTDYWYRAFLENVGLTPNKSKTLSPLKIPDKVFADFLRGCWDGDGHWTISTERRCTPLRHYLCAGLTSGSPAFLTLIQSNIERLVGLHGGISGIHLRYSSRKAITLGEYMYYAPDIPALSRKRAIWQQFANDHPYAG